MCTSSSAAGSIWKQRLQCMVWSMLRSLAGCMALKIAMYVIGREGHNG